MRDESLDDYLERNNLFLCRQLADEEILNLFEPKYDVEIDDEMLIDFAKAILRKAQGK